MAKLHPERDQIPRRTVPYESVNLPQSVKGHRRNAERVSDPAGDNHLCRPSKRRTLQSVRQSSLEEDDAIIPGPAQSSCEKQEFTFNREGSVSLSQCEQEYLIDSDDSLSDTYTDDMEPNRTSDEEDRSAATVDTSIPNPPEGSRKTPLNQKPDAGSFEPQSLRFGKGSNKSTNGNTCCSYTIIAAVLLVFVAAYSSWKLDVMKVNETFPTCKAFYKLEEHYTTIDEGLWDMLEVSVRRATAQDKTRQPGTVLFLHYGPTIIMDGLINNISNITADCFGGLDPIKLDGKYFKRSDLQEDYGVFLAQHKEALLQRGVMVIRNIEDIPARVAQAFHTICDTEEPLVHRAIIYLTLDMLKAADVTKPSSEQSATEEAEKLLQNLWKDSLGPAVLAPLITRLTENVYRIV
uniref:Uncharacterized protein n=1 Tax=Anopheles culicifacies TaxID=139723 RepID=A0A182M745_9DIPT